MQMRAGAVGITCQKIIEAEVMADARRAVEAEGRDLPWGADGDHLKTAEDLRAALKEGKTLADLAEEKGVELKALREAVGIDANGAVEF